MKKFFLGALFIVTGSMATAQNHEQKNITGVTSVEVQNGIELILIQDTSEYVKIVEGYENITTEKRGKNLKIYMKPYEKGDSPKNYTGMKVYVSLNTITEIKAGSGASVKAANEINVSELSIKLDAGATFTGNINTTALCNITAKAGSGFTGAVITGKLKTAVSGGAYVKLLGHAEQADVFCNGGSLIAGKFTAESADIDAKRSSAVQIHVKGNIEANADNTSSITYYGKPEKINIGDYTYAIKRE